MASPLFAKENKNTNDVFKMADFKLADEMNKNNNYPIRSAIAPLEIDFVDLTVNGR